MESTGRFEKKFFKLLENMTAGGADSAFGDGPSVSGIYHPPHTISSNDKAYAPDDGRLVTPMGKVQTRKGTAGKLSKRKSAKKKNSKRKNLYLTGEEGEESKANEPKGLNTSWEDGDIKITIKEVLKYLDKKKVPVKEESTDKLKAIIIADDRDPERVKAANLEHAVIVVVDMEGNWKSILDGNHRVDKATNSKYESLPDVADRIKAGTHDTLPVRELDLREAPEEYKALFNYSIEKEYD